MTAPITFSETKPILLLGFENSFDKRVEQLESQFAQTDYIGFTKYQEFRSWVKQNINVYDKENLPEVIICNYDFLLKNNFKVLRDVVDNPTLRVIPFICINQGNQIFNKKDGLRRGIDDCYQAPVNWNHLRKRVTFLNTYKPFIVSGNTSKEEFQKFKMPIGKRLFDIAFSLGVLTVLSPILLLVAILIKLESKGPLIYKSKRAGTGYQIFNFLKFRSMADGADKKIKELSHLNKYDGKESDGPSFVKLKNDPRVTRIGKVIRKLSIDELPQMLNVLRGDMSVVGNRPLPLYEAEQLTNDQWGTRFIAPAGITGWWQINKQAAKELPESERMRLDIEYAENFSIWFDLKIILKTIPAMIQKDES